MVQTTNPLNGVVIGSLAWNFCWAVIAASVGLNALVESNRSQDRLKAAVPKPAIIDIDIDDVYISGIFTTVGALLIAVLALLFIAISVIPQTRSFAARSRRLQAYTLAFTLVWVVASMIPFTQFFRTRYAKVRASINGTQLPPFVIEQAEKALGATSEYKKIGYLRLLAILPWINALFTLVTIIVLFSASSRAVEVREGGVPASEDKSDSGIVEEKVRPSREGAV